MKSLIVIALAVVCCIGMSEAIKCYQCTTGQNCKDGECSGSYCFKRAGSVGDARIVSKGCQETGGDKCSTTDIGGGSAVGSSCVCDSNWCNAGISNANVAVSMMALALAAMFGLRKMLLD
jgi:hypothetical protein